MFILDSHCDTPSKLLLGRDLGVDNARGQVDFPKLKRGGVGCSFFALYTPSNLPTASAALRAMEMLARIYDSVSENNAYAAMAFSMKDIFANRDKGLISIMTGMENGSPIGESLPLLRLFYRMGVRYMTLTHNGDNLIADAASEGRTWHGLSPFGRKVIEEMNRLGMIIDLAHASDETFYDCLKHSRKPVVSTHSCCRALANHPRNMTDDMLKALSDNGGVIQINFYPVFLDDKFASEFSASGLEALTDKTEDEYLSDPFNSEKIQAWNKVQDMLDNLPYRPTVKRVVDHIEHAVDVAGIDSVGLGSDFDGINVTPAGLENVSKIGAVLDEMSARGFSSEDIEKVAGGNFLRILKENEKPLN